jgi:hypothetical protein
MPKAFPQTVTDNLEKSRSAALAAVDSYNRPGSRFRTEQYLVMIVIAWTALFHAIYYKRGRRPWYRKRSSGIGTAVRYQKVDGDPKHWDLAECLRQYYGDAQPPERQNLEFLLGLRNKIEHRHLPELDASLYGECQASLMNLEEMVAGNFGKKYALTEQLAVSLQFSRAQPPEKKAATQKLVRSSAKTVQEYMQKFRSALPTDVLNSMKYSFSVFLVPKVANRANAADASVEFVRLDEASPEEIARISKLNVLIKERHIPIANLDLYKPSDVVRELNERLPFEISMAAHTDAWRFYQVRPTNDGTKPQNTRAEFCVYDEAHGDYLYTRSWIERLVRAFGTREGFRRVTGRIPRPKPDAV